MEVSSLEKTWQASRGELPLGLPKNAVNIVFILYLLVSGLVTGNHELSLVSSDSCLPPSLKPSPCRVWKINVNDRFLNIF